MPRMYLDVASFNATAIGIGLSSQISLLPIGTLDTLLVQASMACDSYCRRRLQAPGKTTVDIGGCAVGAMLLPVASTLTFDDLEEQALLIGNPPTQELIEITPGGVSPTMPLLAPYPGTVTLATPTQYSHSAGEPIVGYYREVGKAGSSSADDAFENYAGAFLSQEGQMAAAHSPGSPGNFTRKVFLRQKPIIAITGVEYAFSVDGIYQTFRNINLSINAPLGMYGLSYGAAIFPGGLIRTTYTAGFKAVPDDIKTACSYLTANLLRMLNSTLAAGATEIAMGKRRVRYGTQNKNGANELVQEAYMLLDKYRNKF